MCWTCDHPGTSYQDHLDGMHELMVRYGWAIQGVEVGRHRSGYAYTVGLTECGLPELVVTGMALRRAADFLNAVAEHAVHAEPPALGERVPWRGWPETETVEVARPEAHLDTAVAFFGAGRVRALQLVWVDDRGRWPWERGFRGRRGGQPVLGPRAAEGDGQAGTCRM